MSAQKNQIFFFRELLCHFLVKGAAHRCQIHDPGPFLLPDLLLHCLPGVIHRLRLHQKPCTASVDVVIDLPVTVGRIVTDVNRFRLYQFLCHCPAQNAGVQAIHDHLRKQRKNVKIHFFCKSLSPGRR